MTYNTASYGMMIRDERLQAFTSALRRAIVPGVSTVLDIGTGTGIMAFVAASAGAKKVYAVDPNPAIQVAKEIVRVNGLEDRVELFKGLSTDFDAPPCDVIVSDLRGRLPLFQMHVPSIIDARERLLADGGKLLAARDELFAAPVEHEDVWREQVGHWDDNVAGVDMTPARRITANTIIDFDRKPETLIAEPQRLVELDYRTIDSPHMSSTVRFVARRNGAVHGFSMWFHIHVDAESTIRMGPGLPRLVYGCPFLPIYDPLQVREGEVIELEVRARLVRSQYVWWWSGGVQGDATRRFDQCTFDGADVWPADLEEFRLDARPTRSPAAQRTMTVLSAMDGATSLADLARTLRVAHPDIGDEDAAVDFVTHVVADFGGVFE